MPGVDSPAAPDASVTERVDLTKPVDPAEPAGLAGLAGEPPCDRPRPGRRRSTEADHAILGAALDALVEEGYAGMSMEGIASRAGVGKATVYRRWHTKAELVVEALRGHICHEIPLVDTGDVRADLTVMLQALGASLAGVDGPLMVAFTTEKIRHPELRAEFDRVFITDRRAHVRRLVERAVETGDLPADTDVELVCDVGFAILWHRLSVRREDPTADLAERIVRQFLPPVDRGSAPA
jgi:AcrR family transcriptional regulator